MQNKEIVRIAASKGIRHLIQKFHSQAMADISLFESYLRLVKAAFLLLNDEHPDIRYYLACGLSSVYAPDHKIKLLDLEARCTVND